MTNAAPAPLASGSRLLAPAPNPARAESRIALEVGGAPGATARVRVAVYAVDGRLERVLADGELPSGPHALTWDGRDAHGAVAAPGVYWVDARVNGARVADRRLVRLP